jgi:FkbM family methyltransferase
VAFADELRKLVPRNIVIYPECTAVPAFEIIGYKFFYYRLKNDEVIMAGLILVNKNIVAIVRTNGKSPRALDLVNTIEACLGGPATVALDTGKYRDFFPNQNVVIVSDEIEDNWTGLDIPDNWGWFCGDFCYYAAYKAQPDADYYILMDDDVYFSADTFKKIVTSINESGPFSSAAFGLSDDLQKGPKFSRDLGKIGLPTNVGCIFPFTISTAAHIKKMEQLRRKSLKDNARVNDEAIFASASTQIDVKFLNLESDLPSVFSRKSFRTNPPNLLEFVKENCQDQVWHPTVLEDEVILRIRSGEKNYFRHRLRRVLAQASPDAAAKINQELRLFEDPIDEKAMQTSVIYENTCLIDGQKIIFNYTNPKDVVQKHHHQGRFYEEEELAIIKRNFVPGTDFLDIGANIGNHSLFVGKYLNPRSITLIEPNPVAIRMLVLNLALNQLTNICDFRYLGLGLSDQKSEKASINFSNKNLGGAQLKDDDAGDLQIEKGDNLFHNRHFSFVKIDVEGFELKVLRGLKTSIDTYRPKIFIEVDNVNRDGFFSWVQENDYEIVEQYKRYKNNENFLLRSLGNTPID